MLNGITLGIVMIIVLLVISFVLTLLVNAFLIPLFKTPKQVLREIVDVMELKKEDSLVDLGSGDGRLLLRAYRVSMCKCTGYDISPIMLIIARTKRALRYPLRKDIIFEVEDIFKVNLEGFTKAYCYLDEKGMDILKKKLNNFVKGGGEVYSYKHRVGDMPNEKKMILSNDLPLYIYKGSKGEQT